ncbi:MAG: putative DNA binding protein [Haloarculaceae archaeon]|jgi:predicted DNA binding protein
MIVEFGFGTRLLESAVRESQLEQVTIKQLDACETVPLRTVCWLDGDRSAFAAALEADETVETATHVLTTTRGHQFEITHDEGYVSTEVYYAAVREDGIFVSGRSRNGHWDLKMRFPDRSALTGFRQSCARSEAEISVRAIYDHDDVPGTRRYDISDQQREILHLAVQRGYFDVPRRASLADLAGEFDISSQAASERLRRGLDSLVRETLLVPG